ncbi:MAG: hypothetical protein LBN09_00435 [Clostridioides sp.]|jgi:hypothetical protein|nr:hypothetical protein [Clostridioides sp.]
MENEKLARLIAIEDEGIENLKYIEKELEGTFDIQTLKMNQDVDEENLRSLFDGIEILFTLYNSDDKDVLNIARAIEAMSSPRRILTISIDTSEKQEVGNINETKSSSSPSLNSGSNAGSNFNSKSNAAEDESKKEAEGEEVQFGREIAIQTSKLPKFAKIMKMMADSLSMECLINIDITDLREVIAGEKGIKYSYNEFSMETFDIDLASREIEESIESQGSEFLGKSNVILLEGEIELSQLNDFITKITQSEGDPAWSIFSFNEAHDTQNRLKVTFIQN